LVCRIVAIFGGWLGCEVFDLGLDLWMRRVLGFFVVGGLQGSDSVLRVLGVGELFFCGFLWFDVWRVFCCCFILEVKTLNNGEWVYCVGRVTTVDRQSCLPRQATGIIYVRYVGRRLCSP
jgi:hypothetical protein